MDIRELKFLIRHTSVYGIGSIASQAISFLLLPVYTRYLTPEDYGIMALVNATMGILGIVISLGINNATSRFYFDFTADDDKKRVISTVYIIGITLGAIFFPVFYFGSTILSRIVFHSDQFSKLFLIASTALLLGIVVNISFEYMRIMAASGKFVTISLVKMLIVILLNIYFIVVAGTGVIGIFYSSLITASIFSIILSIDLLKKVGISFSITLARKMIGYSFPLIFSNIFRVMVNESDKYFINYFFSPFETGIFSIAQKIASSIHVLITSPFLQTYLPRRFELMKREDAKSLYADISFSYLLAISSIGLALSMFSREIIHLMTTSQYYDAAKYIPFMVLSLIIFGMKYHFQIGIMIEKKTKYIAYINGISSIVNIGLNWVLIRLYGIWGAIIAINVSYAVITILDYFISQKMYPIKYNFSKMARVIVLVCVAYYCSSLVAFNSIVMSLAMKFIIFLGYLSMLFLTNTVKLDQFLTLLMTNFKPQIQRNVNSGL